MPRTLDVDAILAASEAGIALVVARGTTAVTVADLASAMGISQRTFYRWFPTKERMLAPVFSWGADEFARVLRATPGPLADALDAAFAAVHWGALETRTRRLFPLVFADTAAWAQLLFAMHDGEAVVRPALAGRMGVDADSDTARAAAAAVVGCVRLALEGLVATGADPRPDFARLVRTLALASATG